MVIIEEVKTKKQLKLFAKFPQKLYKDNPYYVPMFVSDEMKILNKKKNSSLDYSEVRCFIAKRNDKVVGRIAGIIQYQFNDVNEKKYIRFSRFESIDDKEVAQKLIEAVENYGREKKLDYIHGPWGFNDQDREGLLTYGFDKRATYVTNYNYNYYEKLIKNCGFADESEWVEYDFIIPQKVDERYERIAGVVKKKFNLKEAVGTMPMKQLIEKYGKKVFKTVNECYSVLDCYVPAEGRVLDDILSQFTMVINPRYISVIIDENDEVVGIGAALSDICAALQKHHGKLFPFGFIDVLKAIKKPKALELAIIAVKPEYQKLGINALIVNRIFKNIIEDGIKKVESNPELVTNIDVQSQWETIEKNIIKRRKCFKKSL